MVIFDAKFMGVSFFYAYDRIANNVLSIACNRRAARRASPDRFMMTIVNSRKKVTGCVLRTG